MFRSLFHRSYSLWVSRKVNINNEAMNYEKLYTSEYVQKLLGQLTGISAQQVFKFRPQDKDNMQNPQYLLLTDQDLKSAELHAKNEAGKRLQPPPFLEPRSGAAQLLSEDSLLEGLDDSKFIFTDISPNVNNRARLVVVREQNGKLRRGRWEERDRMNRIYFPTFAKPVIEPQCFSQPYLEESIALNNHMHLLDFAGWYFEPDDPGFIRVCKTIFDHVESKELYDDLWSTRHNAMFIFYLTINRSIDKLVMHYAKQNRLSDIGDLIKLFIRCFPDSSIAKMDLNDENMELFRAYVEFECGDTQKGQLLLFMQKMLLPEDSLQNATSS